MDIDKPPKEDLKGWCDYINQKAVESALGGKPTEIGSDRWSFAVTAICFLAELMELRWNESLYLPIFKDPLRDKQPGAYVGVDPELQAVYDRIIRLIDIGTRSALETNRSDEASRFIADIAAFMKVVVTGKPGHRYSKKVFVGAVAISIINTYNGKGVFPLRDDLTILVKKLGIKMAGSDMNDCLEYYELNHLIRCNQKG